MAGRLASQPYIWLPPVCFGAYLGICKLLDIFSQYGWHVLTVGGIFLFMSCISPLQDWLGTGEEQLVQVQGIDLVHQMHSGATPSPREQSSRSAVSSGSGMVGSPPHDLLFQGIPQTCASYAEWLDSSLYTYMLKSSPMRNFSKLTVVSET